MDLDYQTIFREFNKRGIDYLVVRGLAVNFHGVPRMTYDIDLMILLQSENILRLVSQLRRWGYKPKIPIDPRDLADEKKRNSWIRDKEMKTLAGKCPANPALYAGSRGTTKNEISFPGATTYGREASIFIVKNCPSVRSILYLSHRSHTINLK